jgi:hypothetical protein
VIEPAARSSVSDRRVVQDDQSDHHATQAVDVVVALTHTPECRLQIWLNLGCHAIAREGAAIYAY